MKKVSFCILMCLSAIWVQAQQKTQSTNTSIKICLFGSPENRHELHRTPNRKQLVVFYDDKFVYLQNAIVGGQISFFDEAGNFLSKEVIWDKDCFFKRPSNAVAIEINYEDTSIIDYII